MRIGYNTIRSASSEFAGVAQLVERVIGNDEVHGSDSHHQLQTENHPKGWFFVWKLQRRGVGAATRRCREKSQQCCDLSGQLWGAGELRSAERKQACRSEPKDSHHQLHQKAAKSLRSSRFAYPKVHPKVHDDRRGKVPLGSSLIQLLDSPDHFRFRFARSDNFAEPLCFCFPCFVMVLIYARDTLGN